MSKLNERALDIWFWTGVLNSVDEVQKCEKLGGDHYPVLYCFSSTTICKEKSPLKYDFKDINWAHYGREIIKCYKEGQERFSCLTDFSNYLVNFTEIRRTEKHQLQLKITQTLLV